MGPEPCCAFLLGVPRMQDPEHTLPGHFSGLWMQWAPLKDEVWTPHREQACSYSLEKQRILQCSCPVTQAGTWSHRHGPWDSGVGACEPGSNGNLRPLLLPWVIKLSSASNTHVLCLLPASLKHEQACFVACNRVKPQIFHSFSTQAFIAV